MGFSSIANGSYSTSLGNTTTANGDNSTAMAYNSTASGHNSTAIGNYVSTSSFAGAFVIGDNSTITTVMQSFVNNGSCQDLLTVTACLQIAQQHWVWFCFPMVAL